MSVLGLDVGTTGCKAIAFNLEGNTIASAYREYPLHNPRPGWEELDPEEVWAAVRACLQEVGAATTADPIQALAVSSQGEACHPVAQDGTCLHNSIVTFDARTAPLVDWWLERKSRWEIGQITGMPLHGMYSLNKILWFKNERPEIYAKTWKFLCYEDFVIHRLGLPPTISHSLAARTMALDVERGAWSEEMLGLAGVDANVLAEPRPSGEAIGTIPDGVAADLGLPRGVVVAVGGHDQPAGALGAGILESGEAIYATGTVDCICPVFARPTLTEETIENNLCSYSACIPGLYCSIAFNFTGGILLRWYRDQFAGLEQQSADASNADVYDIICQELPEKPENVLVLPHFTVTGTPHFDTQSRGLIAGLTLDTPRNEVASAILSGVTFEMKLNLELLAHSGLQLRRVRATGGGAKSTVWLQRKADILGIPVAVMEVTEAPALGVAMLAAKAAGLVPDLHDMAASVAKISREIEPDPKRMKAYEERFEIYRDLYPAMRTLNHRLAALDHNEDDQ